MFDEKKYRARVEELVAEGYDRDVAEETAGLEQNPSGDVYVLDDDGQPIADE